MGLLNLLRTGSWRNNGPRRDISDPGRRVDAAAQNAADAVSRGYDRFAEGLEDGVGSEVLGLRRQVESVYANQPRTIRNLDRQSREQLDSYAQVEDAITRTVTNPWAVGGWAERIFLNPARTAANIVRDRYIERNTDQVSFNSLRLRERELAQAMRTAVQNGQHQQAQQHYAELQEIKKQRQDQWKMIKDKHSVMNKFKKPFVSSKDYLGKNVFSALNKGEASVMNYNTFFIMAFAIHIIDWSFGFGGLDNVRILLHLSMAVLTWIFIFWNPNDFVDTLKKLIPLIIVAMIAYYFPQIGLYLRDKIPLIRAVHATDVIFNPLIHPIWVYYGIIAFKDKSDVANTIFTWIVIFWVFYILFAFTVGPNVDSSAYTQSRLSQNEYNTLWEVITRFSKGAELWTKKLFIEIPQRVEQEWQKQIAIATGDYYVSNVDDQAKQPLGLFVESMAPGEPYYNEGSDVAMWATLAAYSTEGSMPVTVQCGKDSKLDPKGIVNRNQYAPTRLTDTFNLSNFQKQEVSCTFNPYTTRLPRGRNKIYFDIEFNFTTQAYYKMYFMDNDKRKAIIKEGIDPFDMYGIIDKEPQTVQSQGPIMVGVGTTNPIFAVEMKRWTSEGGRWINFREIASKAGCFAGQVATQAAGKYDDAIIPLSGADEYSPVNTGNQDICKKFDSLEPSEQAFRITVDNNWDKGRIKRINSMYVWIPKGTEIFGCEDDFVQTTEMPVNGLVKAEDMARFNLYKLKKKDIVIDKETGYRTFRCLMDQGPEVLQDNIPIATRYVLVQVDYTYELLESKEITVFKGVTQGADGEFVDQRIPSLIGVKCLKASCEATEREATQCSDGIDNDNDGDIDYKSDEEDTDYDHQCSSGNDDSEKDGGLPPLINNCDEECKDVNGCLIPRNCRVDSLEYMRTSQDRATTTYKVIPIGAHGYGDNLFNVTIKEGEACHDRDGCKCPPDRKLIVNYSQSCPGTVKAANTSSSSGSDSNSMSNGPPFPLTSCTASCTSSYGCICPDGCVKPRTLRLAAGENCGGAVPFQLPGEARDLNDCTTKCPVDSCRCTSYACLRYNLGIKKGETCNDLPTS